MNMTEAIVTRIYRIIIDDDNSYTLQKKYIGPMNKIPSADKDIENILNEPFIKISNNLFIPTNKIKKILWVNPETNNMY